MQSTYLLLKRQSHAFSKPAKALVAVIMAFLLTFTFIPTSKSYAASDSSSDNDLINVMPTNSYGSVVSTNDDGARVVKTDVSILSIQAPKDTRLYLSAEQGKTEQGKKTIAKRYPCPIAYENGDSANQVGLVQMNFSEIASVDSSGNFEPISIKVYSSASESEPSCVYAGTINPVYAVFPDNTKIVIGTATTTDEGSDFKNIPFLAPENYYYNGESYKLDKTSINSEEIQTEFKYNKVDSNTLIASITFVDREGNELPDTAISVDLSNTNDVATFTIPETIDVPSDNGQQTTRYRTLWPTKKVYASYGKQMNFVIPCAAITNTGAPSEQTTFLAKINLVSKDSAGNDQIIVADSVTVVGETRYTLPNSFCQQVEENGKTVVKTYTFDQNQTIKKPKLDGTVLTLVKSNCEIVNGVATINVRYTASQPGDPQQWVIRKVAAVGGNNTPGAEVKPDLIEQDSMTIKPGETAVYTAEPLEYNGQKLVPFGKTQYTHSYGANTKPVTTIYYVPEDYTADKDYNVTIKYVNLANGALLDERVQTIKADDYKSKSHEYVEGVYTGREDTEIGPEPETIEKDGVTYVRVAGQSLPYYHPYMLGETTYTVFYRDINDRSLENAVITRTFTTSTDAGTSIFTNDNGIREVGLTADDPLASVGAEGEDAAALYGMDGLDTNEERLIADDQNPLATLNNQYDPLVIGASLVALAIAAVLVFILIKRRTRKEEE